MHSQKLRCCKNKPVYNITFETNDSYLICKECQKLPYWSRHVKIKKVISEGRDLQLQPTDESNVEDSTNG